MSAPRTYALLQESLTHLTDIEIRGELRVAMTRRHRWAQVRGNLHDFQCTAISKEVSSAEETPVVATLEEAWPQLCNVCSDPVETLVGYYSANIVRAAMNYTWALSLPVEVNPIAADTALHDAYGAMNSHALERFAPDVREQAEARRKQVSELVDEDPHHVLHLYAAQNMAYRNTLDMDETRCVWQNMEGFQGLHKVALSARRALLNPRVDPWEDFLAQPLTTPDDRETFMSVLRQILQNHQERLSETTTHLVAVPFYTGGTQSPHARALTLLTTSGPGWSYLEVSYSIRDLLTETRSGVVSLGELQEDDTPEILEIAQALLGDTSGESPLRQEGTLLEMARLLHEDLPLPIP